MEGLPAPDLLQLDTLALTWVSCVAQPAPHIDPTPAITEMGVKTKTQLLAERQVLRQLITTVIAASGDKDLQPDAADFRSGVCRHFALLFAAGASTPPPTVPTAADGASRTPRASSLKELDPHLFLDALVEVSSCCALSYPWHHMRMHLTAFLIQILWRLEVNLTIPLLPT
jgi:transformation/transcription domain-associated protein